MSFEWAYNNTANVADYVNSHFDYARRKRAETAARLELEARRARGEDVRTDLEKRIHNGWDEAAFQGAIRDALVMELARIAPDHPLVTNPELRGAIGEAGQARFIKMGRKELADCAIASAGELTSLQEKFKKIVSNN